MTDQTATMNDDQPDLVPFSAKFNGPRTAEVTVDGHRVEKQLQGITVHADAGDPSTQGLPVVTLRLAPHAAIGANLEGLARVYVEEVVSEPGPAAAAFLAAIDPEELEKAALVRPDLSNEPHGLTAAMLAQLQEWASGRP